MPLSINSAAPDDQDEVVTLWKTCGMASGAADPAAEFRFVLSGSASDILVGKDETGRIVASVMVGHDSHRGWLYYVCSAPDVRGMGYGRDVMVAAESWLRDRKIPKMQLPVLDTNAVVVPFYERLGFEIVPRIVMSKKLS